jgi:serine/threonine protein kinase
MEKVAECVFEASKLVRMSTDYTQQQTVGEQMLAEELSLRATTPPAQIPGYRLESLLGQGAFGQVWVGVDTNTGRSVAVKFYLHKSGVNWSLLAREVKNLVAMSANRFIVQVLDVGWDAQPPYYVMEYLENGSLDDLLRQRGALGVHRAVEIFSDIAQGLNHSHGKGVLHCDLKPANVLLDQDMRPRLADFGQSRMSTEQTPSLGTLFYMAPEQADLAALPDARWDVYALGAILYCMLVGTPPHRTPHSVNALDTASNLPERLARYRETINNASPPRAHHRIRGMDRGLIQIIDRCLAKRPSDRYANVQQVIGALERRQVARLRRPLMLLGIVGPLILLGVMSWFAWEGAGVAEREFLDKLKSKTLQSNADYASVAASNFKYQIANLFRLLDDQTQQARFQELFKAFQQAAGPELLSDLAADQPPPEPLRKLLSLPERTDLEQHLKERFQTIIEDHRQSQQPARYNSLFVTDRYGNMIASAFIDGFESSKIGWNFAYRTYFNGQRQDSSTTVPRRNISPTKIPHVSIPFKSTTTGRWKIAVCSPIRLQSPEGQSESTIDGVLVLTINLGDFDLMPPKGDRKSNYDDEKQADAPEEFDHSSRFIALVDGHLGSREGTLLQHPLLKQLGQQSSVTAPIEEVDSPKSISHFQIDREQLEKLKLEGLDQYRDPVARHPLGKAYRGDWIATMKQVEISRRAKQESTTERQQSTDLWILVQEPVEAVTGDVAKLSQDLTKLGVFALVAVLSVTSVMWLFVLKILRYPEQKPLAKPKN